MRRDQPQVEAEFNLHLTLENLDDFFSSFEDNVK